MADTVELKESRYQPFPDAGPLAANMNLDRENLRRQLDDPASIVYCYVVATVVRSNGLLAQTGSGPNFQGGCLTLSTCKWSMRASKKEKDVGDWKGTWVAGLTGAHVGGSDGNYLFFLARVEEICASHRDLWFWFKEHVPAAAEAKATDRYRLGDLYRPIHLDSDSHDPNTYAPPCRDHPHWPKDFWHKDIADRPFHRWPSLLVGEPDATYLWSRPLIRVPFRVGRGYRIVSLSALLA